MKRLFSIAFALVAVTSSLATAEPSKEDLQKYLAFFDKVVDTVVADKADCTKMTGDLNTLMDANKDLIEKMKDMPKGKDMPKDVKDHVMANVQKMMSALQEKCMSDKGVQAALDRMGKRRGGDKK
jgi:hypothetical protein